jgi:hypothetical protein
MLSTNDYCFKEISCLERNFISNLFILLSFNFEVSQILVSKVDEFGRISCILLAQKFITIE